MKHEYAALILTVLVLTVTTAARAREIPVTVSPGSPTEVVVVESRCPTFSWSAVPEAKGYELVVYRLAGGSEAAAPAILRTVPAGVSSWTPSLKECLIKGKGYAWSIRALDSSGESEWSSPSLFSVVRGAPGLALQEAPAEAGGSPADAERQPRASGSEPAAAQFAEEATDSSSSAVPVTTSGVAISGDSITIGGLDVVTTATDEDTLGAITCPLGQMLVQAAFGWDCVAPTGLPPCSPNDFIYCFGGDMSLVGIGVCRAGTRSCNATGTGFDPCVGDVLPSAEICDALDNDCDGAVDEEASDQVSWYPDTDGDGYGDGTAAAVVSCSAPAGYVADNSDCDDSEATVYPGAIELCDGLDNDCDQQTLVDEACGGYCTPTEAACLDLCLSGCGADGVCINACPGSCAVTAPCAAAFSAWLDCRFVNFGVCLSQPEIVCPACRSEYLNAFGPQCVSEGAEQSCGTTDVGACELGSETCSGFVWGACEGAVEPTGEQCDDAVDNDCDGSTDESGLLWYPDADEDGVPADAEPIDSCTQPEGYVLDPQGQRDCDDSRSDVYPEAPEVCDGVDNDCDGQIDEDATAEVCDGVDNDCDGAIDEDDPGGGVSCDTGLSGVCSAGTTSCSAGSLVCNQDVSSSAEVCDGLDNDCDGAVDDGNPDGGAVCNTGEPGVCAAGTETCQDSTVTCVQNEQPSAEVCDGLDNDCNNFVDEGDSCHGEICTENPSCGDGNYCQKAEDVCDGSGSCVEQPVDCPSVIAWACGCEGTWYVNSCYAAQAGVNLASDGCGPVPP